MEAMTEVYEGRGRKLGQKCEGTMELLYMQRDTLAKEVKKHCQERNVGIKSA